MKPIKISSLRCFISLLIVSNLLCFNAYAQNTSDYLSHRDLILNAKTVSDLDKGYQYFLNSKDEHLKTFDTIGAVSDLRLLSIALKDQGMLYESEAYAIEALELLDKSKQNNRIENESRVGLNNHLGLINQDLGNYTAAITYYNKVIAKADNIASRNTGIKNLAVVYSKTKQYKKAIERFLSVLDYTTANESKHKIARLLDNLGFAQSKINSPEALENLSTSLGISKTLNHPSGIITSYLHLAEYYKDRDEKKKALEFVDKALAQSKSIKNKYYEAKILSFKMTLNDNLEVLRYKTLNDSIQEAKQRYKNQFASKKYNFFKEKRRADKNKILKEEEKSKRITYQSIALSGFMLTLFIFIRLKDKHKKEKLQQVYDTESRISKKVHDDIANDIYQVMTSLQTNGTENTSLKQDIEHIYEKARDISKQFGEIDLDNDFKTTLNDLALKYNTTTTCVIVKGISKISWHKISATKKTALYKVLQELLINMKKHSNAALVAIIFENTSKGIRINYNDDGIGCQLKKSNGLLNVENRIKAINGTITFESELNKGFKVKIAL